MDFLDSNVSTTALRRSGEPKLLENKKSRIGNEDSQTQEGEGEDVNRTNVPGRVNWCFRVVTGPFRPPEDPSAYNISLTTSCPFGFHGGSPDPYVPGGIVSDPSFVSRERCTPTRWGPDRNGHSRTETNDSHSSRHRGGPEFCFGPSLRKKKKKSFVKRSISNKKFYV